MDRVFKVVPYKSVNEVCFGDSKETAQKVLGKPMAERMIGYPVSDHYLDDYGYMRNTYNPEGKLISITLTPFLTLDKLFVEYAGQREAISVTKDELIPKLKLLFEDLTEDEDREGFSSVKYGIRIYCPEEDVEDVVIHDVNCYG